MWVNSKRFKIPFAELFLDLIELGMCTLFLQKLHWLPITYHILFKYNLITFKAIRFSQPTYLSSLIQTSSLTHGNQLSLSSVCPRKIIGRRDFTVAPPTEWNRLPQSVRSKHTITGLQSQLKTYLFRLAYAPPLWVLSWIST